MYCVCVCVVQAPNSQRVCQEGKLCGGFDHIFGIASSSQGSASALNMKGMENKYKLRDYTQLFIHTLQHTLYPLSS